MLTAAKYYAAALFLVAVTFLATITPPTAFTTFLATIPADDIGRLDLFRSLVHAWLLLSALVALTGIAINLYFPTGSTRLVARPAKRATSPTTAPTSADA